MKVVIVGSGNVATVLGKKILSAGHSILQVISRDLQHAKILAGLLNASLADDIKNIDDNADMILIAVADFAIKETASQLMSTSKLVVHTAGGLIKKILKLTGNE